jgi:hypothetical protein
MKKYLTLYIENGVLKTIEHDKLGQCSRWWIDNEFPKKGYTFGKLDEVTDDYGEELFKIVNGEKLEIEIFNIFNISEK